MIGNIMERYRERLKESYINHRVFLLNIGKQILKDESLAEDVLQDVYERAFSSDLYKRLNQMSEKDLLAYLVSMLKNRARNMYRDRSYETDFTTLEWREELVCGKDDMVETIVNQCLIEEIRKELKNLPENDEIILKLSLQHQFSNHEIAKMLGLKAGTVRKRLERAKVKLKELCQKHKEW